MKHLTTRHKTPLHQIGDYEASKRTHEQILFVYLAFTSGLTLTQIKEL